MLLLDCRSIKKSFADVEILSGVDLDIQEGERIGLVGPNGAGKTTLANIIYGLIEPDEGTIQRYTSDLRIGYLLQCKDYIMNHQFSDLDTVAQNKNFVTITKYLGLDKVKNWEEERFNCLSGGEKTKLALAEIWAKRPNFLILDEPTNNLDYEGVEWLVEELGSYRGTILIISHDRFFLDQVVSRIVEISNGKATSYSGNYTFFREEKKRQYESQLHQYREQKKYEAHIENEINRLNQWSEKAHREAGKVGKMAEMRKGIKEFYRSKAKRMDQQVKSRIKRLEKLRKEGVDRPEEEPNIEFGFNDASKHGRRIIQGIDIKKSFGERILFQNSSFYVLRGERVGLIGPNGCGKTTLIKIILGDETLEQGELWISPSAKIGYLSQDVGELDPKQNVLESLGLDRYTYIHRARSILANLGFDDEKIHKRIEKLSMGEKIRVKLASLVLSETDLIIMDEPTNHLDIYSREELEDALETFTGTLLFVSHDKYMLNKVCDQLLVFEDKQIKKVGCGFTEYKNKLQQKDDDLKDVKEQIMVIENRITVVLNELSKISSEDSEYEELDTEFKKLVTTKRELKQKLENKK